MNTKTDNQDNVKNMFDEWANDYFANKQKADKEAEADKQKHLNSTGQSSNDYDNDSDTIAKYFTAIINKDYPTLQKMNVDQKTLVTTTDTAAGYLMPEPLQARIVEKKRDFGTITNLVSSYQMSAVKELINVQNADATAAIVAEDTLIATSDPTFTQTSLTSYQLSAGVKSSRRQLLVSPGLANYITRNMAQQLVNAEDTFIISGTGTSQPVGFATEFKASGSKFTITSAASTTKDTITFSEVLTFLYSIRAPYRRRAVIVCRDDILPTLFSLTSGTTGKSVFTSRYDSNIAVPQNSEGVLGNIPVYTSDKLGKTYTLNSVSGSANKMGAILMFDPDSTTKGYLGPQVVESSNEAEFLKHNTVFKAVTGFAHQILQPEGVAVLAYRATT